MTNQDSTPSSWLSLQLGEVIDYGQTEKVEPDNISSEIWVLELEDIERDTSRILQRLTFAERPSKSTKNSFSPGDVLYGKLRPYLNKVIYADTSGVCSTEIIPLKPNLAVNSRYLFHWTRHPEFLAYTSQVSHGVNMPRLGTEAGRQAPFILAPINEQRRIADKLDRVLARVDAANEHLSRVAPLIKRFRQSVLSAATSGQLTSDLYPDNRNAYERLPLGELASTRLGKMLDKKKNTGALVKYIRNVNVRWFSFDLSDLLSIRVEPHEVQSLSIQDGDVLICEGGEPGRCAVWREGPTDLVFQKAIHRARVDSKRLLPEWLAFCLKHQSNTGEIEDFFTGTTIKHLTGVSLAKLLIPVPPIAEQIEIVRRVEKLFAFADRLEELR